MTNKAYDILKDVSLCWFPLIVAFIGVFLSTWNIPHADQILTTLVALNTLMGGVVKYYKARYDKEQEHINRVGEEVVKYYKEQGEKKEE